MKIALDRVGCSFDGRTVLTGITAGFGDEDICWILGAEGAGKSTLGRIICGLIHPDEGSVSCDGVPQERPVDHRRQAARTGMVFQNPDEQFVAPTVERELAFGLENRGDVPAVIRRRVDEALDAWDLRKYRHRGPRTLSGGEKQRLALAGMAVTAPACLVLDEPGGMMDAAGREETARRLVRVLPAGTMRMILSKNPADVPDGGRALILDRGRVIFDGKAGGEEWRAALGAIAGFTEPPLTRFAPPDRAAEPVLRIDNLGFGYSRASAPLYDGVSLTLHPGEAAALAGPVGTGKTTLLSQAAGLLPATAGTVSVCGHTAESKKSRRLMQERTSLVLQFPEQQFLTGSVEEEILFTARRTGLDDAAARERMEHLTALAGLSADILPQPPQGLRYSRKRLVSVISALIHHPALILLDEPFTGLDWEGRSRVLALIAEQTRRGAVVLAVTHHRRILDTCFDRVFEMGGGTVREVPGREG